MKRIIVFWLVLLFPFFCLAKEYDSSLIDIKFDVDDDYIVLTRDNLDSINFKSFNVSKDNMKDIMDRNDIYFDIIKGDMSYEILVVVPKTTPPFHDLIDATKEELTNLKKTIISETGDVIPVIYKNKYVFVVVDYQDTNGNNVINYYTVVNSRGYNIQLQKKAEITDSDKDDLKDIIDSIEFKSTNERKENKKEKKSFNYMILVYSAIIGLVAGVITYIASTSIIKTKKHK